MATKKHRLRKLSLDEVSLVPSGDDPEAHVALAKAEEPETYDGTEIRRDLDDSFTMAKAFNPRGRLAPAELAQRKVAAAASARKRKGHGMVKPGTGHGGKVGTKHETAQSVGGYWDTVNTGGKTTAPPKANKKAAPKRKRTTPSVQAEAKKHGLQPLSSVPVGERPDPSSSMRVQLPSGAWVIADRSSAERYMNSPAGQKVYGQSKGKSGLTAAELRMKKKKGTLGGAPSAPGSKRGGGLFGR